MKLRVGIERHGADGRGLRRDDAHRLIAGVIDRQRWVSGDAAGERAERQIRLRRDVGQRLSRTGVEPMSDLALVGVEERALVGSEVDARRPRQVNEIGKLKRLFHAAVVGGSSRSPSPCSAPDCRRGASALPAGIRRWRGMNRQATWPIATVVAPAGTTVRSAITTDNRIMHIDTALFAVASHEIGNDLRECSIDLRAFTIDLHEFRYDFQSITHDF